MGERETRVVARDEWLTERMELLREEKAATRELDRLARRRQELPWVRVEDDFTFRTPTGSASLVELFGPYRQLIVYHFMFGDDWAQLCDGCSGWAAALDGTLDQIRRHDAQLVVISSASIEKIEAARHERGWSFPWYSASDTHFNQTFHMSAEPGVSSQQVGDEVVFYDRGQSGGINVFVRRDDEVFHTYSCFNRGIQQMNGAFGYVDLLPYGGN